MGERVLLLLPTTTYKADDFLRAARQLGVEVVVGVDRKQALEDQSPDANLTLDFARPEPSVDRIVRFHTEHPLAAVVGADDETTLMAALAAQALDLPHNPPGAARIARDKYRTRTCLDQAGLRGPWYERISLHDAPRDWAGRVRYPCVLKPLGLSASRGVLRADDRKSFVRAFRRIGDILSTDDVPADCDREHLLVEGYLSGGEVALEGLLSDGRLRTLAIFDKPDPLEGPTFEETLYITPSRLLQPLQQGISAEVERGCRAICLRDGPVHAEARVHRGEPWLLELAPRTIGGLCSRTLRFGAGRSLEELVLAHALGRPIEDLPRENGSTGVMMIPVPRRGILREVQGLFDARRVPGIREVTISLTVGADVVPLPEGHRYLGFIFAGADSPTAVEVALREAHAKLDFQIGPA